MVVILKSLENINFMGSVHDKVDFHPVLTKIYAENGVGKSRLFETFTYLLTGKNTSDDKDFPIKNNKILSMNRQDHVAAAVLEVDGRDAEYKKIYKEKHQKVDRNPIPVFTGHETLHYKNGNYKSKGDFDELMKEIAPPKVLKLLTNPLFFNSIPYKERRDILIQIAGDIPAQDILDFSEKRGVDIDILNKILSSGEDMQEMKGRLKVERDHLDKELKQVPTRIDEKQKERPTETEADFLRYESEIRKLRKEEEGIISKMTEVQNEGAEKIKAFFEKKNEVAEVEAANQLIFNNKKREYLSKFNNKEAEKRQAADKISRIKTSIESDKRNLKTEEEKLSREEVLLAEAKAKHIQIKESVFVFDESEFAGPGVCSKCNQDLPKVVYDLESIKAEREAKFNVDKAAKQKAQYDYGMSKFNSLTPLKELIASYKTSIEEKQDQLKTAEDELDAFESAVMPTDEQITAEVALLEEHAENLRKIELLNSILPEEPAAVDLSEQKARRSEISQKISEYTTLLTGRQRIKDIEKRITEIEAREIELSQLMADIEQQIFAIDGYTDSRLELVESAVNDKFEDVSFTLFKKQVNGGYENVCITWYEGNPWESLSTAQKINAGLRCIKALCRFYNTYLPIWVDNNESILSMPEMESQVISLYVKEGEHKLKVVHG